MVFGIGVGHVLILLRTLGQQLCAQIQDKVGGSSEQRAKYTLLAFVAIALHRRLLWFPAFQQAAQVLPLFIAAHLVSLVVRMLAGDLFPGWSYFIAPCFEAVLWPIVSFVFLAPQRRAPDRDENRPL